MSKPNSVASGNFAQEEQPPQLKKKPVTILSQPLRGASLRNIIHQHQALIESSIVELNHIIEPRTAVDNQKCPHQTIDEERTYRANVLAP